MKIIIKNRYQAYELEMLQKSREYYPSLTVQNVLLPTNTLLPSYTGIINQNPGTS